MDRTALLNQLSEKTYEYFQWMGLSPVKCRSSSRKEWRHGGNSPWKSYRNCSTVPIPP